MSATDLLRRDDVADLLGRAPLMHTALETKNGPHVTPELFTWRSDRFWFATARRTLKARLLDTGSRVGVLVTDGESSVIVAGEARPLDPLSLTGLLASLEEGLLAPVATLDFGYRNAPHLAGFLAQGPWAWPHSAATLRMLVAVRPLAAAFVKGDEVVAAEGAWSPAELRVRRSGRAKRVRVEALPDQAAGLADAVDEPAVVALSSAVGPIALPALWDVERGVATLPYRLLALVGAANEADAAVEIERMEGFKMTGKRGVMLRGTGVVRRRREVGEIVLSPERATHWEGMSTETVALEGE